MTTIDQGETCECVSVGDRLRLAFAGQDEPACPVHDDSAPRAEAPIALNDDEALKAKIGAALGAPLSTAAKHAPIEF